ncbi:hypothetical protein ECEC4402_4714, partial [Escherichia coli EC4402]
MPLQSIK